MLFAESITEQVEARRALADSEAHRFSASGRSRRCRSTPCCLWSAASAAGAEARIVIEPYGELSHTALPRRPWADLILCA
jgi:hypothetical protein